MVVEKTDADLVQEVLSGDPDAFNPLVARYQQSVFALAGSIVRDLDAAEDITQEVFIAAYTRLPELKNRQRFTVWLRKIATNAALMWLRKQRDAKGRKDPDQVFAVNPKDRG